MKTFKRIVLLFIALTCFVSCATISNDCTVSVSGTGCVEMTADIVTFNINVSETAPTTGEAQTLTNTKINRILSIIRSFGIEDKDVTTTSLDFSTDYEWDYNLQKSVKKGEKVSQTLFVKMKDIDSFALLADELGQNVSGIRFYSITFENSDHSQAIEEARKLAYEDAYSKAVTYAALCGCKVGNPVTITDGYSSVVYDRNSNYDAKMMTSTAESVATEIPSGSLSVTVNTEIVFRLLF